MHNEKKVEWVLRVAVAGEFIGHGVFALEGKEGWFKYFEAVGITSPDSILSLMNLIGVMDITLGIIVLLRIVPVFLLWMSFWGLWTAILRPLGGDPIWDFVERSANWGAPLALLFLHGIPRTLSHWFK